MGVYDAEQVDAAMARRKRRRDAGIRVRMSPYGIVHLCVDYVIVINIPIRFEMHISFPKTNKSPHSVPARPAADGEIKFNTLLSSSAVSAAKIFNLYPSAFDVCTLCNKDQ